MGRESRRPKNYGDAARLVMARGSFVVKDLWTDLRVLEHFQRWRVARDLPMKQSWMHETKTPTTINAMQDAIWRPASPAELTALADVLREMGVRFLQEDPYPWAVAMLVLVFQTAAHNAAAPPDLENQLMVEAKFEELSGIPPGRFPRHEGKDIARDVAWVYRHLIKHPTDSIRALADEWAEQEQRATDARSVVQNGIDRGIHWLDLAMSRQDGH